MGEGSVNSLDNFEEKCLTQSSLVMKLQTREIEKHINTIWNQNEIVKFLSECETNGINAMEIYASILPTKPEGNVKVPTLFDSTVEIIYLAVLTIICGENIEDGFSIALKILKEFKLKPVKVYCEVGKQLAKVERYDAIAQLVNCIKQSGTNDNVVTDMCDEMLTLAVATFTKANVSGTKVEDLIKLISDRGTKVVLCLTS